MVGCFFGWWADWLVGVGWGWLVGGLPGLVGRIPFGPIGRLASVAVSVRLPEPVFGWLGGDFTVPLEWDSSSVTLF